MQTTSKSIETLNDLIQINNDRVAGFEKAAAELKEDQDDLKSVFHQLAGQSRTNANQLAGYVGRHTPRLD
jgi:ribosomal protein S17E